MEGLDRRPNSSAVCVLVITCLCSLNSLKQGLREKLVLLLMGCCCSIWGREQSSYLVSVRISALKDPAGSCFSLPQSTYLISSVGRFESAGVLTHQQGNLNWTNKGKLRMGLENNWYEDSQEQSPGKRSFKIECLLSAYEYFWPLPSGNSQL